MDERQLHQIHRAMGFPIPDTPLAANAAEGSVKDPGVSDETPAPDEQTPTEYDALMNAWRSAEARGEVTEAARLRELIMRFQTNREDDEHE